MQTKKLGYDLKALANNAGFYILSINTKGELWIPREWPRLKSYINGERVYRKEKVKR